MGGQTERDVHVPPTRSHKDSALLCAYTRSLLHLGPAKSPHLPSLRLPVTDLLHTLQPARCVTRLNYVELHGLHIDVAAKGTGVHMTFHDFCETDALIQRSR